MKYTTSTKVASLPEKGESVKMTSKRNTLKNVSLKNKASKENFSTFPKKILRSVLLHQTWLATPYHDVLYEKQKLTNAQKSISAKINLHMGVLYQKKFGKKVQKTITIYLIKLVN